MKSPSSAPGDDASDIGKLVHAFREEREHAALYRALAANEGDHRMAFMLQRLGETASEQMAEISERLNALGVDAREKAGPVELGRRARLAIWLASQLGVRPIRTVLSNLKVRGLGAYDSPHLRGHVLGLGEVQQSLQPAEFAAQFTHSGPMQEPRRTTPSKLVEREFTFRIQGCKP